MGKAERPITDSPLSPNHSAPRYSTAELPLRPRRLIDHARTPNGQSTALSTLLADLAEPSVLLSLCPRCSSKTALLRRAGWRCLVVPCEDVAQRLDGTGNQTVHGRRQAALFWLFATCSLSTVPRIGWSCSQQANVRHSAGCSLKDQATLKNQELHRGQWTHFQIPFW